jgi:hypothetical protein
VPVREGEAKAIGYDAEKAFAKGWTSSTDGWLKKVPVSEYMSDAGKIKEQLSIITYLPLKVDEEKMKQVADYLNAPEPSISPIQEDWKENLEKAAAKLIDKYCDILFPNERYVNLSKPKQCALIAVDEILNVLKAFNYQGNMYDDFETGMLTTYKEDNPIYFWQSVKEEINKI